MKKAIISFVLGCIVMALAISAFNTSTTAPITGFFASDVQSLKSISDANKSDTPVVLFGNCRKGYFGPIGQNYSYACSLFYNKSVEIRRIGSTGSMWPTLSSGYVLLDTAPSELKVGDIVVTLVDGKEIVHRIYEIGEDEVGSYFVTKGDNSAVADGKVRADQIVAKVVGIIY